MSKKKCVFNESCELFNERAITYSNEEYEILNEFCKFEKFVDDLVTFFYSQFSLDDLQSMKITIVKFIMDNQKIFGFQIIYPYSIYFDLVTKFLCELD